MTQIKKSKHSFVKKSFAKLSIEDKLVALEVRTRELKRLIVIRDYFIHLKKKRNSYIVEMRRQMTQRLLNLGYDRSEIARTLSRDHASILSLIKTVGDPRIEQEVADNMDDWMDSEMYPESYEILLPSSIHKNGVKSEVRYKLKSLWDKE